jgi:hypothetical protein
MQIANPLIKTTRTAMVHRGPNTQTAESFYGRMSTIVGGAPGMDNNPVPSF